MDNIQFVQFLDKNSIISNSQFYYRKHHPTEIVTTLLLENFDKNDDNGKLTGAVFIVLSSTVNTLGYSKLLAKFKTCSLGGTDLESFANYLFRRA